MRLTNGRYFRVTGRVQGVGFRAFTLRQASALMIRGWVRNCPDGTVEGEAIGADAQLIKFFEKLNEGPPYSSVESLFHEATQTNTTQTFEIRR